jgi:hypothetical protein
VLIAEGEIGCPEGGVKKLGSKKMDIGRNILISRG